MEPVETYEHAGIRVDIHYDPDCQSPREWAQVGTIMHWHLRYDLGESILDDEGADRAMDKGGLPALSRYLRKHRGATVVLPIGLLDHSGLSIWVGGGSHATDPGGWDSGTVGVIFDTPESRKETGVPLDKVEEALRGEIEEYDRYLRGDTYGFVVADGTPEEDSCWGFIGEEYCREEANSAAEYAAIAREKRTTQDRVYLLDPEFV